MSAIELTEKLLTDAGGWQAMKQARSLAEAGRVGEASYAPPLLKGRVRDGGKEFQAGLKISSGTNIENLCTCRASREWGTVCAHSLAVGLAVVRAEKEKVAPAKISHVAEKPAAAIGPSFSMTEGGETVQLHVILPLNFTSSWEKGTVVVGVEAERAKGGRILIHALPPQDTFRVGAEDFAAIEKLRALSTGALPGMIALSREQTRDLLGVLRGHPRVTFGKSSSADPGELLQSLATPAQPAIGDAVMKQGTPEFSLSLEGSLNHLAGILCAHYGEREFVLGMRGENPTGAFRDSKNPSQRISRNPDAEAAATDRLRRAGFGGPDTKGAFALNGKHSILSFFAAELPAIQRLWKVSIGARFEHVTKNIDRITPRLDFQSSGEDWFELSVHLEASGGQTFSAAEIKGCLQRGQKYVRLKNDRVAVFGSELIDELENVLRDCSPQQRQPGRYRIDRVHAGYIDAALGDHARITGTPEWQTWSREQRQLEKPRPVPLGDLEGVLRPYQKDGVYWMHFLARHGLGGILADEMGLGKTVQALAFIRSLGGPALIVCPSALIYNWQREAERFTPELKLLVIAGSDREQLYPRLASSDLAITSYPILRRDIERYRGRHFAMVILDEAQHIKNPNTQNAQAASALKADTRFVLTGTPVENSVRDLWSITHFVAPGYLGTQTDFRERYERPISQSVDSPEKQRLANRIRPFLLRRLKKDVLSELPDKIEQVAYCELSVTQRSAYSSLLEQSRSRLDDATRNSTGSNHMAVLTALLRLRQICCDLRLLDLPEVAANESSAKLELLWELLQEALDGGHKVLIFSQFVSMLQLMRERLQAEEAPFCYLDGATRNRAEQVDRFQGSPEIAIFLISLKAGGVGLNLTAADTVIHYDPWWNPAVEAQATDRAHRIGQDRVVTSYKLIARNTVEEKILNLQRRKRAVIDATVESEQPLMTALTLDDLGELLA